MYAIGLTLNTLTSYLLRAVYKPAARLYGYPRASTSTTRLGTYRLS